MKTADKEIRKIKLLEAINKGTMKNKTLAIELNFKVMTVSKYKTELRIAGLIEMTGKHTNSIVQLTKLGLEFLGLDTDSYKSLPSIEECVEIEIPKTSVAERVLDRRIGILGYLSFGRVMLNDEISKLLNVTVATINTDVRELKKQGLLDKVDKLTEKGLEFFNGYDCSLY